ncbi:MAG: hypothetical protein IT539_10650 [Bradyrhizobiaceae bacterium]|nr:hypothetical protein [Bradyrhizobiaceae bacterium]
MVKATHYFALVAAMTIAMTAPGYAYLDPGTGSILLQAIIGGVAATLFVVRGYLYRLRGWFGLVPKAADENRRTGKE